MKKQRLFAMVGVCLALALLLSACGAPSPGVPGRPAAPGPSQASAPAASSRVPGRPADAPAPVDTTAQIYLYGELHGVEAILEQELAHWQTHYNRGLRHLFIEMPYFCAEHLNRWMQADNDDILLQLQDDMQGTLAHGPAVTAFYQTMKQSCPETIFHGTDVGHLYDTVGQRYLATLAAEGLAESEEYALAEEAVAQGRQYYQQLDEAYRENTMVENFIREFVALGGQSVMGIYGAAHTTPGTAEGGVPTMAAQLQALYGEALHTVDLSEFALMAEPLRVEKMEVAGREYQAAYFGEVELAWAEGTWEFWRLEEAYDTFKDCPTTGSYTPCENYPMAVKAGQVFVIDAHRTDGSTVRGYYRADGEEWQGKPITVEFTVE